MSADELPIETDHRLHHGPSRDLARTSQPRGAQPVQGGPKLREEYVNRVQLIAKGHVKRARLLALRGVRQRVPRGFVRLRTARMR